MKKINYRDICLKPALAGIGILLFGTMACCFIYSGQISTLLKDGLHIPNWEVNILAFVVLALGLGGFIMTTKIVVGIDGSPPGKCGKGLRKIDPDFYRVVSCSVTKKSTRVSMLLVPVTAMKDNCEPIFYSLPAKFIFAGKEPKNCGPEDDMRLNVLRDEEHVYCVLESVDETLDKFMARDKARSEKGLMLATDLRPPKLNLQPNPECPDDHVIMEPDQVEIPDSVNSVKSDDDSRDLEGQTSDSITSTEGSIVRAGD